MPPACHGKDPALLTQLFEERRVAEAGRVLYALDKEHLAGVVRQEFDRLADFLQRDNDEWLRLIPGKSVLKQFSAKAQLDMTRLKRLYLNAAQNIDPDPFSEVRAIFASFASFSGS